MEPLTRHPRAALQFSGGKDSLALVYLLREHWERLTLYHVDTGDLLPEVREIVSAVEAQVPHFIRLNTQVASWQERFGLPSDLVPTTSTPVGRAIGASAQSVVDRFTCCGMNLMQPMHQRMLADRVSLVIRGTKRADLARLPASSGDTSNGYELWLPLQDWTHEQVLAYLRDVGAPICRVYEHKLNAPECATCPAWWNEGRAEYLGRYHPELFAAYRDKLRTVAHEVLPHYSALTNELTQGGLP